MREKKLLLNEEKTEILLIGTKQQLAKVDILPNSESEIEILPKMRTVYSRDYLVLRS